MDGLEDLRLTISERTWDDVAPDQGEPSWNLTIPDSIGLQLRPFNGPGSSVMALPFLTACCRARAVVLGTPGSGVVCGNCRLAFPHSRPALQLVRENGVGSWTLTQASRDLLHSLMDHDLDPLAANVQASRVIDVVLQLFDKLDTYVIPLLRDRRARLPLQRQASLFVVIVGELREEHEWLELT